MKRIRNWFAYWKDFFLEVFIYPWCRPWFAQSYKVYLIESIIILLMLSIVTAAMEYKVILGSLPRNSILNYFVIVFDSIFLIGRIANYPYLCWKKLTVHKWYKVIPVVFMSLYNLALIGIGFATIYL